MLERAHGEVGAQRRRVYHERKAEAAAGVGQPDGEDHETADRDADGRRPWEDRPAPEAMPPLPRSAHGARIRRGRAETCWI